MTDAIPSAAPSAPSPQATGSPTHVTQQQPTDYQTQAPSPAPVEQPKQPIVQTPEPPEPTAQPSAPDPKKPAEPEAEPPKPIEPISKADEFKLPDEYKDKAWAAKVKSQDDLYKQIDNLTTLVGKKAVVPNLKDATPEDRETFYAQLRGKDASEYQIPKTTSVPIPEDTQSVIAKLFMDNGISPVQAEPFLKGYLELREKQIASHFEPEAFKSSMLTAFGSDWEKTTGQVRSTITAMMSPEDQKMLDAIPNHLLGTVYRTLGNTIKAVESTLKKYGATETFAHLTAPSGGVAPADVNSARQQYRDQLSAMSMRPHTAQEVTEIQNKLAATYMNDPRLTSINP